MAKNSIPTTEPKFYFKDEKAYLSKPITERLEKLGLVMDEYVSNEYFHSFDTHQVPVCVAKQFLFDRFDIFISTRVHRYVDCLTTERYHCFHGVVDDLSLSVRSERILGNDFDTEYEAYKDAIEFSLFLLEEKSKTMY